MNIILLSGGSGTRLWPLSNEVRSKQFLKVFKNENGNKESMVQRVFRMIKLVDKDSNIIVATSENQVPQIIDSLGNSVNISVEPCRKDTFPAISLSCFYLAKSGVSLEEPVIVTPVDSFVEESFFKKFVELSGNVNKANLTLLGIKPTYPSEKFGYILPNGEFFEKPNSDFAKELIGKGALWNGGVFAFKLGYMIDKAKEILKYNTYNELFDNYDKVKKISIDYAVAEHEKSISVIKYDGEWKDLGTWNTLTEAMIDRVSGNAISENCNNTHVINELSIPLISIGIDNSVIVATPDGILVSDKEESSKLKDLVKNRRPMYEKRNWGEYKVLDYKVQNDGNNSLTKELIIKPGEHISYQIHKHRTEMWTFISGEGELIIDGVLSKVGFGDTAVIKPGTKHAIKALSELHIIEVQIGDELTEDDIERLDYNWG